MKHATRESYDLDTGARGSADSYFMAVLVICTAVIVIVMLLTIIVMLLVVMVVVMFIVLVMELS